MEIKIWKFFTIDGINDPGESEWWVTPDHVDTSFHDSLLHKFVFIQSVADAKVSFKHVRRLWKFLESENILFNVEQGGLLRWPKIDDRNRPWKMTEFLLG